MQLGAALVGFPFDIEVRACDGIQNTDRSVKHITTTATASRSGHMNGWRQSIPALSSISAALIHTLFPAMPLFRSGSAPALPEAAEEEEEPLLKLKLLLPPAVISTNESSAVVFLKLSPTAELSDRKLRPSSSLFPISRKPMLVEAAPLSSTSVRGVALPMLLFLTFGSAPADTSASMTSTDALRILLYR